MCAWGLAANLNLEAGSPPAMPARRYNLIQSVLSFNFFVDVMADQSIRLVGEAAGVTGYEKVCMCAGVG